MPRLSMEFAISASGDVETVQLMMAPSKQSRMGLRQTLPSEAPLRPQVIGEDRFLPVREPVRIGAPAFCWRERCGTPAFRSGCFRNGREVFGLCRDRHTFRLSHRNQRPLAFDYPCACLCHRIYQQGAERAPSIPCGGYRPSYDRSGECVIINDGGSDGKWAIGRKGDFTSHIPRPRSNSQRKPPATILSVIALACPS